MKKRIFAVAAALCLLAGTGAFAQDSKKAPMMKERPTAEQMRAYRKAQAEKMKGILTPEQFEQWKQMQGPRHGMNRGPRMKDGRGDKAAVREGRKCAPCAGDRKCDGPCSGKEKK